MPEQTVYQIMIELSQARGTGTLILFAGAFSVMLFQYAIERSSFPFIKRYVSTWRSAYWTLVLVAYLAAAAYLLIVFPPQR